MGNDITRQGVLFEGLCDKPVIVKFDEFHGSSDGGALLLKAADARLGLTAALAACMRDDRHAGKIVIHLPQSAAYHHDWWQIARSLGAAPS